MIPGEIFLKIYNIKIWKMKNIIKLEYKNCEHVRKSSNSKDKQSIFIYY